jgi:hypothetical protein
MAFTNAEKRWHQHVTGTCEPGCPHCVIVLDPFTIIDMHQAATRDWMTLAFWGGVLLVGILAAWSEGYPPWWFLMQDGR